MRLAAAMRGPKAGPRQRPYAAATLRLAAPALAALLAMALTALALGGCRVAGPAGELQALATGGQVPPPGLSAGPLRIPHTIHHVLIFPNWTRPALSVAPRDLELPPRLGEAAAAAMQSWVRPLSLAWGAALARRALPCSPPPGMIAPPIHSPGEGKDCQDCHSCPALAGGYESRLGAPGVGSARRGGAARGAQGVRRAVSALCCGEQAPTAAPAAGPSLERGATPPAKPFCCRSTTPTTCPRGASCQKRWSAPTLRGETAPAKAGATGGQP